MKILFIGDIFGAPGVNAIIQELPKLKKDYQIDFTIAQAENVSGRKGLNIEDYHKLKQAGIDVLTMGNHVWAKSEIKQLLQQHQDIIRPLNIASDYPGSGSQIFHVNNKTLRVTSILGITFNKLNQPWKEEHAENFFDHYDQLEKTTTKADYHLIDFHAETTSEKAVFGLYLDGKVDAFVGTHTHVQTADAKILPKGTIFISDVGMTGPTNCAIGVQFDSIYQRMRHDVKTKFIVSQNKCQINAVVIKLTKPKAEIIAINYLVD